VRVLLIEDAARFADRLRGKLEADEHDVTIAGNRTEAYQVLERRQHDIVLLDLKLPADAAIADARRAVDLAPMSAEAQETLLQAMEERMMQEEASRRSVAEYVDACVAAVKRGRCLQVSMSVRDVVRRLTEAGSVRARFEARVSRLRMPSDLREVIESALHGWTDGRSRMRKERSRASLRSSQARKRKFRMAFRL